jgi:hypothetical protein
MKHTGKRRYSSAIINLDTKWIRMVRFMPLPLYPKENSRRYPLYMGPVGSRSCLNVMEKRELLLLSGIETFLLGRPVCSLVAYWAVPAAWINVKRSLKRHVIQTFAYSSQTGVNLLCKKLHINVDRGRCCPVSSFRSPSSLRSARYSIPCIQVYLCHE